MSGKNINSSKTVVLVVDQFRGLVTEGKHNGAEIISLMYSSRSFMSLIGGNSFSQQLFNFPLLSERGVNSTSRKSKDTRT